MYTKFAKFFALIALKIEKDLKHVLFRITIALYVEFAQKENLKKSNLKFSKIELMIYLNLQDLE